MPPRFVMDPAADSWQDLVRLAMQLAGCSEPHHVHIARHAGWGAELFHFWSAEGRPPLCACGLCSPIHRISAERLMRADRLSLAQEIAQWLCHLDASVLAAALAEPVAA